MIERMVCVRHGAYVDDNLSDRGVASIHALAPKVKAAFAGASPILVISSPARRARQTAKILCGDLKIGSFQQHEELEAELDDLVRDLEKTHEAFLRIVGDAKYVLVSTHKPIAKYFPWWFAKQTLGVNLSGVRCEYGDASYLDCVAKTLIQL